MLFRLNINLELIKDQCPQKCALKVIDTAVDLKKGYVQQRFIKARAVSFITDAPSVTSVWKRA